jgi:hypothetical protein
VQDASSNDEGYGWLVFSAIMLMTAGVMRFFDGIWALNYNGDVPANLKDGLLGDSLSNYGWTWIVVGIILFLAGMGVLTRSQLARWIGIFAAAIGAISAVWWMPYYPVWSLMYIFLAIFVIYGLSAYGSREVRVR